MKTIPSEAWRQRLVRAIELAKLRACRDRMTLQIAEAISSSVRGKAAPEARQRIDAIERLRQELNASTETIEFQNWGVGTPDGPSSHGTTTKTTVGETCRRTSKDPQWAFLLFQLVQRLRPETCLELGTSVGISAAYQAAALELNRHGRLVTLEGAVAKGELARRNFSRLGLERVSVVTGQFRDTLGPTLASLQRVDFAFVDGHHDGEATLDYFNRIAPFLSPDAVIMFDDIRWSSGMQRAWEALTSDPRIRTAVDFGTMGLCVAGPAAGRKRTYTLSLGW